MDSISRIIKENGGMEALRNGKDLRVVNRAGASLVIERLGLGSNVGDIIAVSQYEPHGTLFVSMRFEVDRFGWLPGAFLDGVAGKDMHVFTMRPGSEIFGINLELQRRLEQLAREWDEELKRQGFIEADERNRYYPLFSDEQFAV